MLMALKVITRSEQRQVEGRQISSEHTYASESTVEHMGDEDNAGDYCHKGGNWIF